MTTGETQRHSAELEALVEIALAARNGAGGPVLVLGESGSGKTYLVDELCRQSTPAGLTVLWASCESAPDAPALWPWFQLLRQYLRGHGAVEFPAALQDRMAEVITLVPEVSQVLSGRGVPESLEVEAARFRLFDAVAQVLLRAAEDEPLLVVMDDLQAADESSLALLRHVANQLSDSQVVLVALSRPLSPRSAASLRTTVEALTRARGSRRLELARRTGAVLQSVPILSPRESEVATLVTEGLSNREIAERLHISERTAENHVENILNKLGQTSRTQIATWVARGEK